MSLKFVLLLASLTLTGASFASDLEFTESLACSAKHDGGRKSATIGVRYNDLYEQTEIAIKIHGTNRNIRISNPERVKKTSDAAGNLKLRQSSDETGYSLDLVKKTDSSIWHGTILVYYGADKGNYMLRCKATEEPASN